MKPISFKEQTTELDGDEYLDLPVHVLKFVHDAGTHKGEIGTVLTSCWSLSWKERLNVLLTGRVYHSVMCELLPEPVRLFAERDFQGVLDELTSEAS
jgi:hypothetical protein